jgi:carboxyl-terminal processing protease
MLALGVIAWSVPALAVDAKKNDEETYRLLSLFGDVFERVRAEYVEPPSEEEMIEAAITGMLAALDPHSSYLNAKNYQEMQVNTRGEFGGLGIQVTMEAGFVKVISPIDDTPAFRAGIESGDIITHLDGESVQGLTLAQAVDKMRGKVGSDIRITVVREGREPFDVTITRSVIKITSVRSHTEGKVGYVRITSFNEQTDKGLDRAIKKLKDEIGKDIQGYVLDLRNNPGGLLDQAIAVSDAFLDRGEIVSTRSRKPEDTQRFNAREGDLAEGLPVVVLINGGSAGVEPDIVVKPAKYEEIKADRPRRSEADLRGALDADKKDEKADPGKAPAEGEAKSGESDEAQDYQLARALDLIRGLAIMNQNASAK